MNISDFKAALLAREDIDDILRVEAVEVQKTADNKYNQVVHDLESGRTLRKYDVHVIGTQNGQKNTFSIPVAVYNQGQTDEAVEELRKTITPEVTESQIEAYIKSLPFVGVRNLEVDAVNVTARFEAIEVTGANAGREVKVFAYKPGNKPPTYLILS